MISKIYNSNKILHKTWSRKGKTKAQIALKEEYFKPKKKRNKEYIQQLKDKIRRHNGTTSK